MVPLFNNGTEDAPIYSALEYFSKVPSLLSSLQSFKILVRKNYYYRGQATPAISFQSDYSQVFRHVTELQVRCYSSIFLNDIKHFNNLISLDTDIYSGNKDDEAISTITKFFLGLIQLKNLKFLKLGIAPVERSSEENKIVLLNFLKNFALPDCIEDIELNLGRINWIDVFSFPGKKSSYLPDTNPLEDCEVLNNFCKKWENLINLQNLSISITNQWDNGYVLNRYLTFLIFTKIRRVRTIYYYYSISEGRKNESFPPLDLFLFFQSIPHLSSYLTSISIHDWGDIYLKKSLDKIPFQMPNLQKLSIIGKAHGNYSFCTLPKIFTQEKPVQQEMTVLFDRIQIQDNEAITSLLDSIKKIPLGVQIYLNLFSCYQISLDFLIEQLCLFFSYNFQCSLVIDILAKNINEKSFEKLKDILLSSPTSAKLKIYIENSNFKDSLPAIQTQSFQPFEIEIEY